MDKEFILMLHTVDENLSWYAMENLHHYSSLENDPDFRASNKKHAINGYLYGNLPNLQVTQVFLCKWGFLKPDRESLSLWYLYEQEIIKLVKQWHD